MYLNAWLERPIYSRLPETYTDNNIADWLTHYYDELLIQLNTKIDDIPRQLNPALCDPVWLDFLAPLCGFTPDYWDVKWTVAAKRTLLSNSWSYIWKNKGTKEVLSFILNALDIEHEIVQGSDFILGKSQLSLDSLGESAWEYVIYLPTSYEPNGYEFQLTRRINSLFGCYWCRSSVEYKPNINLVDIASADTQAMITMDDEYLLQL